MSRLDSDDDEQLSLNLPIEPVLRIYGIYNTDTRVNLRIHAGGSDAPCVYYVNTSTFTPDTPDVQLRTDDAKAGPVVAFGQFHNFSGHVTLGLGDPDDTSGDIIYEELRKESRLVDREYMFETDLGEDANGVRRTYVWRRTIGQKSLLANYSCCEAATGRLVAYFAKSTGRESVKKVGELCVTAQTSTRFDELLLLSWLAIREKENRNAWYAGGMMSGTA